MRSGEPGGEASGDAARHPNGERPGDVAGHPDTDETRDVAGRPHGANAAEEGPTVGDELTPEELLRVRLAADATAPTGARSRLTPATLVALLLLGLSAAASLTYVLARGSAALPSASTAPVAVTTARTPSASPALRSAASIPPVTSPPVSVGPSSRPASALPATPSAAPSAAGAGVRHYAETDPAIVYAGSWGTATGTGYEGGSVAWTSAANASATLGFTGRMVTWYGPVGPTRGSASVYVDGTLVAAVSEYTAVYAARNALFQRDLGSAGFHSLRIVAAGTPGHPVVAIDEIVVGS